MKTFKRFKVVERVYESDASTARRTARAMDKFYYHKKACRACQETRVCFTAGTLWSQAQKVAEPRFEEREVDVHAHPA